MSSGFETLNLHPNLKKAIDALGFTSMTPIQQKVLKFTLAGHDAIGRAQTGTGKTAAFLISVINDLLNNPVKEQRYRGEPRALILAPTRELALQIESDALELTKYTDLSVVTLVGGVDFDKQKAQLDKAPVDIMVATPGRLIDFVEQKEVWLDLIEFLVIDEADRLLDMGFIPSVKRIVRFSPRKEQRQTLMFSATFSYDVLNLAQQWLFEPVTVEIEPEKKTNADVEQRVYMVATPGRLIDFVEQKEVWLDLIEFLVIDEADRLLDMGFIPSVKRIVRFSPRKEQRQTLMFSATFSYDVLNLAQQWLFEPVTVEIEPEKKTNADVEQRVYMVAKADKYKLLQDILRDEPIEKVMIFANRRDQVRKLYDHLKKDGYKVVMLSGEIAQDKRLKMLDQFKNGKHNIMIATDVAGRGIHVDGVSHVVNFTLPEQSDDYVHRIGRTGRAGTRGVSISFLSEDDAFYLPEIEKAIGQKLPLTRLEGYC